MYGHDRWIFYDSIEHELKCAGNYGAKGEKRAERKKPTPELVAKQNQLNREKYIRRVIKANFRPYDVWACLKYPKGTRKTAREVKKDVKRFMDKLRKRYRKAGQPLKWIRRIEIGPQGGVHVHILVNRLRGEVETDILIQELWQQGRVNYESLYASGGYEKLAAYIVKQPDEQSVRQLSLLPAEEQEEYRRYSSSRNLVRPQPVRKLYTHWTMRRILQDGPKPTKGFYIDQDSVVTGVNAFTGMTYLYYTEYRIRDGKGAGGKCPEAAFLLNGKGIFDAQMVENACF